MNQLNHGIHTTSRPLQQSGTLPVARAQVKNILTQSQAFKALPKDSQIALAKDMVKVANFIAGGEDGGNTPAAYQLAGTDNANPPDKSRNPGIDSANLPDNLPGPGKVASDDFDAAAAEGGAGALTNAVTEVNFPKFVAGLIDGVFNAIVDASIKQMEAYAELVKNVAKSVDQFMKDNVTENQSRDYLVGRYPDYLEIDLDGEAPKVKPKEGHDQDNLPDFFADLGLAAPVESLDEETAEQMVPFARRRIAMDRQQLLATMVLMGINRIVVTNGSINASVNFRLDTTDMVKRGFKQTAEQEGTGRRSTRPTFWSWFSPSRTSEDEFGRFKVSTVQSDDSEATSKMHVDLAGKVSVNFKTESFPLDKMTDMLGFEQFQEKLKEKGKQSQPGAATPAGTPAAPQTSTK